MLEHADFAGRGLDNYLESLVAHDDSDAFSGRGASHSRNSDFFTCSKIGCCTAHRGPVRDPVRRGTEDPVARVGRNVQVARARPKHEDWRAWDAVEPKERHGGTHGRPERDEGHGWCGRSGELCFTKNYKSN